MNDLNLSQRSWREIRHRVDMHIGLGALERLLVSRWFNPLSTMWLNFRSFPLRQAWRLPVWVYGWPRLECLSGYMRIASGVKVRSGMVRFNFTRTGAPNSGATTASLMNCGTITFGGRCRITSAACIRTIQDSELYLGDESLICEEANISCFGSVHIGHRSWVVHRAQVLESNNHFVADLNSGTVAPHHRPIFIGDDCWVCNSSTIAGGAVLPNGTIVASHSLVNADFSSAPENPTLGGVPAKVIGSGKRRVDSPELVDRIRTALRTAPVYTLTPTDRL